MSLVLGSQPNPQPGEGLEGEFWSLERTRWYLNEGWEEGALPDGDEYNNGLAWDSSGSSLWAWLPPYKGRKKEAAIGKSQEWSHAGYEILGSEEQAADSSKTKPSQDSSTTDQDDKAIPLPHLGQNKMQRKTVKSRRGRPSIKAQAELAHYGERKPWGYRAAAQACARFCSRHHTTDSRPWTWLWRRKSWLCVCSTFLFCQIKIYVCT